MSKEEKKAWCISGVFHLIIIILLLLIQVNDKAAVSEFVEVAWNNYVGSGISFGANPGSVSSSMTGGVKTEIAKKIELPERRMLKKNEDVIRVRRAGKLTGSENTPLSAERIEKAFGEKESIVNNEFTGNKNYVLKSDKYGKAGDSQNNGISNDDGIGADISYSLQWSGGGFRKLLRGDLPAYPEGVNVEAQIKIQAVIMPNGSVKSLQPMQKGNTKLENAAMEKVCFWKFEPLKSTMIQMEQTCVITFNFKLQ
jgi:hypothetical protein